MLRAFKINGFNITTLDAAIGENRGQAIMQFDEDEEVFMSPGTEILVDELDGNACIMSVEDFRVHVLKCISILSKIDPLFGELLDCEDDNCEEHDSFASPIEPGDETKL